MQQAIRWVWAACFPWLLALALVALPGVAAAQRVEGDRAVARGTYATEVTVRSQGAAERNTAFARGLSQVLGRISGSAAAASQPGVGQELRRAKDYVEGYDYRQDEGIGPSGAPSFNTTLVVRFDPQKVDAMVAALGLPVWPQPRPKPVVWLAIDDGKGPRLVAVAQNNAARPLTQRAIERGFRLGLPAGGAAEQAAVGAIWRGDTAAIARLSSRYQPPMQLVGKLYRSEGGWTADWIFVDGGRVLSKWSSQQPDARRALAAGADGAADALVRKYAKRSPSGTPGPQRILVTGIGSSQDLINLSAKLQGISVVRRITPVRATPETLELELDLSTGLPGFRRLIGNDVLVEVEAPQGDVIGPAIPVFRLR